MSMISEQVDRLKHYVNYYMAHGEYEIAGTLGKAADTIEKLSAKLEKQNMERSTAYYNGATDINVGDKSGWISVEERLPQDDRKTYIVQKTNGSIDVLGFTKDAYRLDKYDFVRYKGKKKPIFYDYDSEYGYIEWECEAWQPLPEPYKGE